MNTASMKLRFELDLPRCVLDWQSGICFLLSDHEKSIASLNETVETDETNESVFFEQYFRGTSTIATPEIMGAKIGLR